MDRNTSIVRFRIDADAGQLWIEEGTLYVGELTDIEIAGYAPAEGRNVQISLLAPDGKTPLADNSKDPAKLDLNLTALRDVFCGKRLIVLNAFAFEIDRSTGNTNILADGMLPVKWSPFVSSAEGEVATLQGRDGDDGKDGDSAYQLAVKNGFNGTEKEWLKSLHGLDAYELAKQYLDFQGTIQDWFETLRGPAGGTPYIGPNGHWFVFDTDTGMPSRGEQGDPGEDGKDALSAEEIENLARNAAKGVASTIVETSLSAGDQTVIDAFENFISENKDTVLREILEEMRESDGDSVHYHPDDGKSDAEKAQARQNIGAAPESHTHTTGEIEGIDDFVQDLEPINEAILGLQEGKLDKPEQDASDGDVLAYRAGKPVWAAPDVSREDLTDLNSRVGVVESAFDNKFDKAGGQIFGEVFVSTFGVDSGAEIGLREEDGGVGAKIVVAAERNSAGSASLVLMGADGGAQIGVWGVVDNPASIKKDGEEVRTETDNICHKDEFGEWAFSRVSGDVPPGKLSTRYDDSLGDGVWILDLDGQEAGVADCVEDEDSTELEWYDNDGNLYVTATRRVVAKSGESYVTPSGITGIAEDAVKVNPSTALALKDRDCCLVAYTEGMTFTFAAKEEGQTGLRSFEVIVTGCTKDGAVNWPAVTYRGDSADLIPEDGDNHWTFAEQQDGSFAVTRHIANTFTIGE